MTTLRPIADAPRDGTPVIVFVPGKRVPLGIIHRGMARRKVHAILQEHGARKPSYYIARWLTAPSDKGSTSPVALERIERDGGFWCCNFRGTKPVPAEPTYFSALPDLPEDAFEVEAGS